MEAPAVNQASAEHSPPLRRVAAQLPLLASCGLLLLIAAQSEMQRQQWSSVGLIALLGGLIAWALVLRIAPPPSDTLDDLVEQRLHLRWLPLALAGTLAAATWIMTSAGVYTIANVAAWIATVVTWCWAWWPGAPINTLPQRSEVTPRHGRWLLLLAFISIIGVGAFFRFYRLTEVPADPTSDHAEKLLDIFDLLNGRRPIFFPRNTGREPAQFYLTFGLMRLLDLPLKFETLKLGTAFIGLLAIPAVFLFAREVAGRATGLIAAALYAIAKWPVNTARMGLRFPYGPLPTALTLWLLWRYLRRGDRRDALWCGLVIGLGLHGYISFRVVPLLVPLVLLVALLLDRRCRRRWRRLIIDGCLIAITALLTCLPLAHYSVQHPDQVWYRVATRAANTERPVGGWIEQLHTFAINNVNALLAFNWRGDATVVNAVRFDPFLDLVTAAALLAGVLFLGYQIGVRRAPRYAALVLTLPVLALASTLSLAFPIENPSANRMGVVAPVIFTIAALPLAHLVDYRRLPRWTTDRSANVGGRLISAGVLVGALVLASQQNYVRYFHDYDQQYRLSVPNTHEMARTIQTWQERGVTLDHTYLLAYPYWLDGRNLALALGDLSWQHDHDLRREAELPPRTDGQPLLFVLNTDDERRRDELHARFRDGQLIHIAAEPPGSNFDLYFVPAR